MSWCLCETVRARLIGLINLSILNVPWLRDDKWTRAVNQSDGTEGEGHRQDLPPVSEIIRRAESSVGFHFLLFYFWSSTWEMWGTAALVLSALLVSFSNLLLSKHFVNETLLKHDSHFKFNMRLIRYWKPEGPINTLLYLHLSSGCKKTISNECFY